MQAPGKKGSILESPSRLLRTPTRDQNPLHTSCVPSKASQFEKHFKQTDLSRTKKVEANPLWFLNRRRCNGQRAADFEVGHGDEQHLEGEGNAKHVDQIFQEMILG